MTITNRIAAETLDDAADAFEPGDALRDARYLLDWTQHEMADRLGTDQARISEWESGRKRPNDETRQKFRALADELRE